jgi:hypothetical protein
MTPVGSARIIEIVPIPDMKSILLPLFAGSLLAQQAAPDPLLRWMDGIAQRRRAGRQN